MVDYLSDPCTHILNAARWQTRQSQITGRIGNRGEKTRARQRMADRNHGHWTGAHGTAIEKPEVASGRTETKDAKHVPETIRHRRCARTGQQLADDSRNRAEAGGCGR